MKYIPEEYWSKVASELGARNDGKIIAGDDEPYYRYKRAKTLDLFKQLDFRNKSVLEIGSGPGGNLNEVLKQKPLRLAGADISAEMIKISRSHLPQNVELHKINGYQLPFENKSFDIVYSITVLQHITDDNMFQSILSEMARVSKSELVILERIEKSRKGNELNLGRPVSEYVEILSDFKIEKHVNLRIYFTYLLAGISRKVLNKSGHTEGEKSNSLVKTIQNIFFPITKAMDKIFKTKSDLSMIQFVRK